MELSSQASESDGAARLVVRQGRRGWGHQMAPDIASLIRAALASGITGLAVLAIDAGQG